MADESDYFQSIFQNKTFVFICVSLFFLFFGKKVALYFDSYFVLKDWEIKENIIFLKNISSKIVSRI